MHLVTALWRFLAFKSFNARSRRRARGKAFVADKFDIYVRTCVRAHNAGTRTRAMNSTDVVDLLEDFTCAFQTMGA